MTIGPGYTLFVFLAGAVCATGGIVVFCLSDFAQQFVKQTQHKHCDELIKRLKGELALHRSVPKCRCQLEAGDSPCPTHGEEEAPKE